MKISYNVFLNVCFFYFFYIKNIYFINNDNNNIILIFNYNYLNLFLKRKLIK